MNCEKNTNCDFILKEIKLIFAGMVVENLVVIVSEK